MITVDQLIGELLLRHNCVIIPAFGGFVARHASATIDYKNGIITPPKKSLLFNRQLTNNDGLLISELAAAKHVSYTLASEEIKTHVAQWNEQLQKGERISIDKVGFLFLDAEKNMCFEQDRFFNLLLQSYGLGKVHFIAESDIKRIEHTMRAVSNTAEITPEPFAAAHAVDPVIQTLDATHSIPKIPTYEKRTSFWKYVAAASFIPLGFYSYWLPMRTNILESGIISIHDFNPFYEAQKAHYHREALRIQPHDTAFIPLEESIKVLPKNVSVYSYQYSENVYIPVQIRKQTKPTLPTQHSSNPPETPNNAAFEYIVGCFGNEQNAQNLLAQLKQQGMAAHLSKQNGLYRVSAGSADTEQGLQTVAQTVLKLGLSGWVAKNK